MKSGLTVLLCCLEWLASPARNDLKDSITNGTEKANKLNAGKITVV